GPGPAPRAARLPRGGRRGGMVAPYAFPFTGSAASAWWPDGTGRPCRPTRPASPPCLRHAIGPLATRRPAPTTPLRTPPAPPAPAPSCPTTTRACERDTDP